MGALALQPVCGVDKVAGGIADGAAWEQGRAHQAASR
jgi:hypothetical protein